MNLKKFSEKNRKRSESPQGFNHKLDSWSPAEWTNAIAGELGEAANLTKKILRHDQNIKGNIKVEDQDREKLRLRVIEELADVFIYVDLAIQALGGDTSEAVKRKFYEKSKEIGYESRRRN